MKTQSRPFLIRTDKQFGVTYSSLPFSEFAIMLQNGGHKIQMLEEFTLDRLNKLQAATKQINAFDAFQF